MATPAPKRPNLDSVTTINDDGSRYFLHPADVHGKWTVFRRIFGILLIVLYVALPWIPINGEPALFFDVENRRFHVFGLTLVPQDLWVMFFGITGLGFSLFFITSLLGRLWCGWACPYTVFLDHIFRRIERWIEGDAQARRKLDAAPWTSSKVAKRVTKHLLYALCSTLIAHVFLSYFVSLERLYAYMGQGPMAHATSFGIVAFLTLVLWFCFGYFREQFCIIMCPYGRIQSALTDDDTVIIGYDEGRGEPRGAKGKVEGDCIDCRRCVNVCPTGIDIRNGLQLECIGCAACIDACDDIMRKVGRPTGLVRYDSLNGLTQQKRRILRPRIIAYTFLGLLGLTAFGFTASQKARPYTAAFKKVAMAGQPFQADAISVRNFYELRFLNKRNQEATFAVTLVDPPTGLVLSGGDQQVKVPAQGEITRQFVAISPIDSYQGRATLTLRVTAQPGDVTIDQAVTFLGPSPESLK
ncbi:cytochrome c oxidase accessory protein FixG [Haloferula luteola]|uniref:Cytochrome c oxidase accessory protein FixG n=1 Tax=Haloferula luteola TaxID=595692 RepID=A0A840V687_9BACT|nr:cytochrome c oxidase accessory protein CcoG [Haloferula luteola]MBB5350298.1 cytochrome c oxidase accessory protein FixG [Haloferula luteola]